MYKAIWGDNGEKFNLVGSTPVCINFLTMQILRLISFMALTAVFGMYSYIYLRTSITQYNFWALTCTYLAFGFLFIGSGKQVVYQKLVNKGRIDYKDRKKKTNMWMIGVFFYSLAIPMVIVSNLLYFVSF
jgi:Ca2+/Na+ antiporter